ncbi:hypothetical protein BJ508DRAFT_320370 [Ascobolus immersus RN42]|uniref:Uncharacterized protein n=1 Tax=Ascobolus immersus RN42 TaxID=1160509 RepID=A0A3N4IVL7_ASCIM|nr:hypothetical protein BJ508DRAFT_320370 [Ascobolus immersus RN42]
MTLKLVREKLQTPEISEPSGESCRADKALGRLWDDVLDPAASVRRLLSGYKQQINNASFPVCNLLSPRDTLSAKPAPDITAQVSTSAPPPHKEIPNMPNLAQVLTDLTLLRTLPASQALTLLDLSTTLSEADNLDPSTPTLAPRPKLGVHNRTKSEKEEEEERLKNDEDYRRAIEFLRVKKEEGPLAGRDEEWQMLRGAVRNRIGGPSAGRG